MTEYERGFIDGIKSKVSAELTPTLINVSKTMLEMLKPVLSTALENALNDNNAINGTDVQPVDRWISVKDRLPEENILVLCYARSTTGEGNNYFLGALAHGEFWFLKVNDIGHVSCPVLHWEVTHWQPLPESPKED